jgi:hypothetical protein
MVDEKSGKIMVSRTCANKSNLGNSSSLLLHLAANMPWPLNMQFRVGGGKMIFTAALAYNMIIAYFKRY